MMLLFCSVNAQNSGKTEIFPYLTDNLLYVTNINELNNPLYRSAYVEFNRNEFKKAINLYNSYLAISPDEANGYFKRAAVVSAKVVVASMKRITTLARTSCRKQSKPKP